MSIYMFKNQISAISYRFAENGLFVSLYTVVGVMVVVVFGKLVYIGLAGRLSPQGAFMYYYVSYCGYV